MSNYTAVPTEELENWQEARELEMLNCKTRANRDIKAQRQLEGQARIREPEQVRQQRMAEVQRLFWTAFGWAAGCSALVILAHTGAIAGWVMQIGTTVLSFLLGLVCGRMAG